MAYLMAVLNASSRVFEAVVTLRHEGTRPSPLVTDTLYRLADTITTGGPPHGGSPLDRLRSVSKHWLGEDLHNHHWAGLRRTSRYGDGWQGDGQRGDGERGDGRQGDGQRGDGQRGDGRQGDGERGDEHVSGGGDEDGGTVAAGEGIVRAPLTSRTRNLCAAWRPSPSPRFVQPWLSRAAGRPGGPGVHYRVEASATPPRAGAADTAARARPGRARHPALTSFGADGTRGPSPSG